MKCQALTHCMAVGHKKVGNYYVSIDNIFIWISEVQYTVKMKHFMSDYA
jgi:hypothetical protein